MAWGALRSALSRAPGEVRVLAGIGLGLGVSTGIVGAYWFTLPDEVDASTVLDKPRWPPKLRVNAQRVDESDDAAFYAKPRMVDHVDAPARAQLSAFHARMLPAGGRVLDLCSSCTSHLAEGSGGSTPPGRHHRTRTTQPLRTHRPHHPFAPAQVAAPTTATSRASWASASTRPSWMPTPLSMNAASPISTPLPRCRTTMTASTR